MNRKLTAALLITAAVLMTAGFTVLGSVFDYPDILKRPVGEVLAAFRTSQAVVMLWFTVLAAAAALFAPIAVGVGRLSRHPAMRLAVPVGIAAGVVQVIGLSRWPLLVPGYAAGATSPDPAAAAAAVRGFATAHTILGQVVGESLGYFFTAVWTLLVVRALAGDLAGRWFTVFGSTAAVLVLVGLLSPLGLPLVDLANFVGYVLWSLWAVTFGVLLLVRPQRSCTETTASTVGAVVR